MELIVLGAVAVGGILLLVFFLKQSSGSKETQPVDKQPDVLKAAQDAVEAALAHPQYPCCPHCHKTFDPGDVPWTCPKCGHMDPHWNAMLNCEVCRFSPDDTTDMQCPHCGAAINVMGIFFVKQQRYRMRDFFMPNDKFAVTPEAHNGGGFAFDTTRPGRFFTEFKDVEFDFDGQIGFILIQSGRDDLPRYSFATGFFSRVPSSCMAMEWFFGDFRGSCPFWDAPERSTSV